MEEDKMKTWLVKTLFRISIWLFDKVYDLVDMDDDGKISKDELFDTAKYLDKWSKDLVKKLK